MASGEEFSKLITEGYTFKGQSFRLGAAMVGGQVVPGTYVSLPLRTLNRHGLIAGATGTGKTKTLQVLAEGLSNASVPVLMMDIKGDLSGIAEPGTVNPKVQERAQIAGIEYKPGNFPVELLSLSNEAGVRLRSTVSEFGPVLIAKILGLNETQEGVVSMIFKYCDDKSIPLLDLKDLVKILQFAGNEGKKELEAEYGKISTTSTGTILRKVIELQQQGADLFFGEPSFDINDLMRIGPDGKGMINIVRVTDMQNRPKLFSTFMLGLLAELFADMPEEGDMDQPKLVIFIDEAHLIFQEATPALLQQIEMVVKLIRSKGVGIFFCTQNPQDVPASVLSQLGLKIQHALRAFTAADRKTIRQAAENFPESSFYEVDKILTEMGIGEALVTLLNEKGIPTPLVHTYLIPPQSRMDTLTNEEISQLVSRSQLAARYNTPVDNQSAYEILTARLNEAARDALRQEAEKAAAKEAAKAPKPQKEESIFDNTVVKQAGRTAASILTRTLLGALGLGTSRRRKKGIFG